MANANQMACEGGSPAEVMMRQESIIETYGYSVIMTWDDEGRPFCYTVGRAQNDLPELLLFGMLEDGKMILNDIAPLLREDAEDGYYRQPDWVMPLYAGQAHNVGEYARWAYGRQAAIDPTTPVRVMQIVAPDAKGRMPWENGCDPAYVNAQPLHITPPQSRRAS